MSRLGRSDRPGISLFMGAKLNAWFSEEFWCWWCRFRFGDIKDSLKANHHTTINCVGGDRIREFDQMRAIGLNIGSKWMVLSLSAVSMSPN